MTSRWQPSSEGDLKSAEDNGLLDEETHFLEFKREVTPGSASNKELARDLASFAVDGGLMIVGVRDTMSQPRLSPTSVAGLPERVEQIALSAIDPPLYVRCRTIPSVDHPGLGYLIIDIPPSPDAPHQVGGTYFGRGDKTKRRLSDRDVGLLMSLRADDRVEVAEFLCRREADFLDVVGGGDSLELLPAVTLVALPRPSRPDMMLRSVGGHYQPWLIQLVTASSPGENLDFPTPFSRMREQIPQDLRGQDGWRLFYKNRPSLPDIYIGESGAVSLCCAELGSREDFNGVRYALFNDREVLGLIVQFVHLLDRIARDADFTGRWHLGLSLAGFSGRMPSTVYAVGGNPRSLFPEGKEAYRETTSAVSDELASSAHRVADRLVARFVRASMMDGLDVVDRTLKRTPFDREE